MEQRVIITGQPVWTETVVAAQELAVASFEQPAALVERLFNTAAVLLLVDGARSDWREWVAAVKTEVLARKILVAVVTDDAALAAGALDLSADAVLPLAELAAGLPDLLACSKMLLTAEERTQLVRQCAEPLPPLGLEAITLFNRGEYYQQHDLFEELWMQERGPVRRLYQGILQVGIAYFHLQNGKRRSAIGMLLRAQRWLALFPDVSQGVDVAGLRADATHVYHTLLSTEADDLADFDVSLFKPVRLVDN